MSVCSVLAVSLLPALPWTCVSSSSCCSCATKDGKASALDGSADGDVAGPAALFDADIPLLDADEPILLVEGVGAAATADAVAVAEGNRDDTNTGGWMSLRKAKPLSDGEGVAEIDEVAVVLGTLALKPGLVVSVGGRRDAPSAVGLTAAGKPLAASCVCGAVGLAPRVLIGEINNRTSFKRLLASARTSSDVNGTGEMLADKDAAAV